MLNRSLLAPLALSIVVVLAGCSAESADSQDPTPNADLVDGEEVGASSDDLTAKLTFADAGSIVTGTCGGCHAGFRTLAGIKANKKAMVSAISSGRMPRGTAGWKTTPDGKKALTWLKTGADLK